MKIVEPVAKARAKSSLERKINYFIINPGDITDKNKMAKPNEKPVKTPKPKGNKIC